MMQQQWRSVKQTLITTLKAGCLLAGLLMTAGTTWAGTPAADGSAASTATPAGTRTTLSSATSSTGNGTDTTLIAHVTDTTGTAVSGGTVSFRLQQSATAAGATVSELGAAVVGTDGTATLTLNNLPAASDGGSTVPVTAVYHAIVSETAPAAYADSVSAVSDVQSAAVAAADFTFTANPASVTTTVGGYATTVLTITPVNGFNEAITLSCSSLPADVTCNFTPTIHTTSAGAFTSTLQLQTQGPAGALARPRLGPDSHAVLAFVLPGVLALLGLAGVRRRAFRGSRLAGVALLLIAGTIGLGGCNVRYGYIKHPPVEPGGVAVGTFQIAVNASGNNGSAVTQHNISVALVVK